jgi:hypothetical protein
MRFWAILGDLRKNRDFQALRFNAILGDLRRFKKKFLNFKDCNLGVFKVIEFYILLRFLPTGQNWQGGLG